MTTTELSGGHNLMETTEQAKTKNSNYGALKHKSMFLCYSFRRGFAVPFLLVWKLLLLVTFPFRHVVDGFTQPVEDIHTTLPEYTRSVIQPDSVREFELHRRNLKALAEYYRRLSKYILDTEMHELELEYNVDDGDLAEGKIVGKARVISDETYQARKHVPFAPPPVLGSKQLFSTHLGKIRDLKQSN